MARFNSLLALLAWATLSVSSSAGPINDNSGRGETKFYPYTSEWSFASGWYRRHIAQGWITTLKRPPYESQEIRGSLVSSQNIYEECCQRYERGQLPQNDRRRKKKLSSSDHPMWRKPEGRAYEQMCFNDAFQATSVRVPARRETSRRRVGSSKNNDNNSDQQDDVVGDDAVTRPKSWSETPSEGHHSTFSSHFNTINLIPNVLKGIDWGNVAVQAGAAMRDVGDNTNWAEMMPKRVTIPP